MREARFLRIAILLRRELRFLREARLRRERRPPRRALGAAALGAAALGAAAALFAEAGGILFIFSYTHTKEIFKRIKPPLLKKKMPPIRLFFFDTETNGLPLNYKAPPTQVDKWPEIVSIAWEVWRVEADLWTQIATKSYLAQPPEGIRWNTEAERIHGISYERARSEGVPLLQILGEVETELAQATHVVAHNIAFDRSILLASMMRHKGTAKWITGKNICTMMETVSICKIISTSPYATAVEPYKWPRLQELHHFLFKKEWEGVAHEALSDVQCMRTCYRALVERGCLTVE